MTTRYRAYHQPIRLDRAVYADIAAVVSVTVAVKNRQPVFADAVIAADTVDVATAHAQKTGVRLWAYCVMPDHVHLLVQPSPTCDVVAFIGQFKSLALRAAWRHGVFGSFWQTSFWDHFIRNEEERNRAIHYILDNPLRAKLVGPGEVYPFCGMSADGVSSP